MRKMLVALSLGLALLGLVGVSAALADTNLPNIPAHRHFVQTPEGQLVEVGPRVCDDASLQAAFNQFHSNVHRQVAGSEGPTQSAPGLHNGYGADLFAAGCSFTP